MPSSDRQDDPADDVRASSVTLFTTTWRIGRERLRQQDETLARLFAAASDANAQQPPHPRLNAENMTDADWQAFSDFFERSGTATGTRDAYATAIVMVIDDILKMLRQFYDRVPNVPQTFAVTVRGNDLFSIFRAIGNNIRHYQEWRAPTYQIPMAKQAYWAVEIIATVVGRDVPAYESLSVMASNWAWPVLHAVAGGTYDGLVSRLRIFMDELIRNVGMENDPLVLAEIAKERQLPTLLG